jgi:UDP-GlcNAc:undecaprenyl-phosphate GlcNAc-1-phosphate transferase
MDVMKNTIFAKNLVSEKAPISLIVHNQEGEVKDKTKAVGLNWVLFSLLTVFAGVLLLPQTRRFFISCGWRWAYILSLSFALSFCLNPAFGWLARRFDITDRPNGRKLHQEATPLLGGAAVFSGFLSALLINGIFSLELGAILVAAVILFGVGVLDDLKEMKAGIKLILQLGCSLLVIAGGIVLRVIPDDLGIFARLGNAGLTAVWIIGITNAMNFFDGMDGLAAGLGALVSFFLGVVAFQTDQPFLGWIAVAMMGGCLGFLPFNFRIKGNATIFLGDAGSTVIGFILACVAVYGDWAQKDPVVALISPLLIFWIFIFDMVHITVDRVLTGKVLNFRQWIEYVGQDHLHHRLANALGGQKKSVIFIYLLSLCLGASAIVLRNARPIDAVLLVLQASIMVVLITILERRGRMANGAIEQKKSSRMLLSERE